MASLKLTGSIGRVGLIFSIYYFAYSFNMLYTKLLKNKLLQCSTTAHEGLELTSQANN